MTRRGLCLVLASPSGGGKSSIARTLVASEPDLSLSISVTTRAPRPTEREGADYYFRTRDKFDVMAGRGELLEWAEIFGHGYGTPRAPVEQALAQGRDLLFDIDWQGFRQLRAAMRPDVIGLFILPPSLAELRARLIARGTDGGEEIARRMHAARAEISHAGEFDHIIVNHDFDASVAEARAVLHAARTSASRLIGLDSYLAAIEREV